MLYSIQNAGGQVYGFFNMSAAGQSRDVWAAELGAELDPILGINGVVASEIKGQNGLPEDHIVIDIDFCPDEAERLATVHETIGRLTFLHSQTTKA